MWVLSMRTGMRKAVVSLRGGLGLMAVVAGVLSLNTPASAKMLTLSAGRTATRKSVRVQFPELPPELKARIQSKDRSITVAHKRSEFTAKDWGLINIGFFDALSQKEASAPGACQSEVIVAVIDTGIDYKHPDLIDSIYVKPGESGPWSPPAGSTTACRDKSCNGIDDDNNGYVDDVVGWDFVHDVALPYDTHGHGTHIAGIINNIANTGTCPKLSILPLKYYDNSGAGFNNLANTVRAIHYAIRAGAQIINYSGGGADPAPAERAAVEEARRKGVLFVAAAGNDGHNNDQIPYYPASYGTDNIIGVASVNKLNQLLPSSNYGKTVHIGAPGLMILSTLPEGKYGTMSGTSQATAYVSGAAAYLAMQQQEGAFDFKKIKNWLIEGSRPAKFQDKNAILAAGLLSMPRAVQAQRADRGRPTTELAVRASARPRTPSN